MCGIAGHAAPGGVPSPEDVTRMAGRLRHRGPDHEAVIADPSGQCVLAHTRLSVIDLSPCGHQPMVDPETGNRIVFNGEIYNFGQLRGECEQAGDRFASRSDTEVVLKLYRRYGVDCLSRLRGMFAFALWDAGRQVLFIARDRVGKKPLHYALVDGGLLFASEIDALARHPRVSRELDDDALELFLECQYVPAPRTIYRGIRKLPPAHYGIFDCDGLRIAQYWNVDYRDKVRISMEDAADALEEKLTEAVRLRMISDVPLGALLSGGVDSSVVVALMSKLTDQPVRTFSIGFREEDFNELGYAAQVAEACATRHHPEIVDGDVADLLPLLARRYGEPYADSSAVPSFFVARAARRHVTVALNGDGGDELLGGYPRYWLSSVQLRSAAILGRALSAPRVEALATRLSTARSLPARAMRRFVTGYAWPELRSVNMYAGFWSDHDRAELLGRPVSDAVPHWRASWLAGAMANADNPVDRMLWYDNRTYLPGDLLVKMDIASMHCALETRSPLLDHEVIEFCARLPVEYKVRNGIGKFLLKQLASKWFPHQFVHRPKMGFGIPVAAWLRGPLRPLLEETLRSPAATEPLDHKVVQRALDAFLEGGADTSSRLWTLLMYGVWRRDVLGAT